MMEILEHQRKIKRLKQDLVPILTAPTLVPNLLAVQGLKQVKVDHRTMWEKVIVQATKQDQQQTQGLKKEDLQATMDPAKDLEGNLQILDLTEAFTQSGSMETQTSLTDLILTGSTKSSAAA